MIPSLVYINYRLLYMHIILKFNNIIIIWMRLEMVWCVKEKEGCRLDLGLIFGGGGNLSILL